MSTLNYRIRKILYNLKDFCWAGVVQPVHPKARQFYSFKNQTDFDHKWGQKEMIEFLSAEIFEITEWRLTGWLKYWHTGDYVLMIASVQHLSQNISAPTSSQPAQLPRYLTNEDNAVRHLTVIIATQFISRDEFFFFLFHFLPLSHFECSTYWI